MSSRGSVSYDDECARDSTMGGKHVQEPLFENVVPARLNPTKLKSEVSFVSVVNDNSIFERSVYQPQFKGLSLKELQSNSDPSDEDMIVEDDEDYDQSGTIPQSVCGPGRSLLFSQPDDLKPPRVAKKYS